MRKTRSPNRGTKSRNSSPRPCGTTIRDNLSQADLKPIDLYLSAFGPALRVISEHWGTERESANPDPDRRNDPFAVTPTDALQVARREVSRHRAQEISREWANNPVDRRHQVLRAGQGRHRERHPAV